MDLLALSLTDTATFLGLVLIALIVGLPQILERRGSYWKEIAEERAAAIAERDGRLSQLKLEKAALELRPDLSAVQEQILEAMKMAAERWEAQTTMMQRHEERAAARTEKILEALQAMAAEIHERLAA